MISTLEPCPHTQIAKRWEGMEQKGKGYSYLQNVWQSCGKQIVKITHGLYRKVKIAFSSSVLLNSFTPSSSSGGKNQPSAKLSFFLGGNLMSSFVHPMPKDKQVPFLIYYKLQADSQSRYNSVWDYIGSTWRPELFSCKWSIWALVIDSVTSIMGTQRFIFTYWMDAIFQNLSILN